MTSRRHLPPLLLLLVGTLPAEVVETIKPSEAFALLAHCRRHAASHPLPLDFKAEVLLRTDHLLAVKGSFDGRAIAQEPAPRTARDLAPGTELMSGVVVFHRLVINATPDLAGIDDMIASGPAGTTRIVFRDGMLLEHVADPFGNTERYEYPLADSELYSAADHRGPGAPAEDLVANPGGGGAAGSGAAGTGDNAESGNGRTEDLIIPFGDTVSPTA